VDLQVDQHMQPVPAFFDGAGRVVEGRIEDLEEALGTTFVIYQGSVSFMQEISVPSQNSAMQEPAIPLRQRTIRSATENRMFRLRTPQNDINRRTKPM
jgi:hypothetical protein